MVSLEYQVTCQFQEMIIEYIGILKQKSSQVSQIQQ